jgi:hypothetical protein
VFFVYAPNQRMPLPCASMQLLAASCTSGEIASIVAASRTSDGDASLHAKSEHAMTNRSAPMN